MVGLNSHLPVGASVVTSSPEGRGAGEERESAMSMGACRVSKDLSGTSLRVPPHLASRTLLARFGSLRLARLVDMEQASAAIHQIIQPLVWVNSECRALGRAPPRAFDYGRGLA